MHFVGITKPLLVITELGWNSHWWFSWKRSHLNILNHPLPTSNSFWNYTSAIWHPHPACRTNVLPWQWFRQQEVVPYFPGNAVVRVLSLLFEELNQGANSSFPLGWSCIKRKIPPHKSSCLTNPSDQGLTEQRRDTKCEAPKFLGIPRKFPCLSTQTISSYSWSVKLTGEWCLPILS